MTDILNPIFFNLKSFNDEEAILSLEKYMLFRNSNIMHKKNESNLQDKPLENLVEPVTEKNLISFYQNKTTRFFGVCLLQNMDMMNTN
jgi:hypothetical protein